jgi:hypothetical protein
MGFYSWLGEGVWRTRRAASVRESDSRRRFVCSRPPSGDRATQRTPIRWSDGMGGLGARVKRRVAARLGCPPLVVMGGTRDCSFGSYSL